MLILAEVSPVAVLELVPRSWFSWNFNVLQESLAIAEINISTWRERGGFVINGSRYDVYREGFMSGAFILESNGTKLASAQKPSALVRLFKLEHAGKTYQWEGKAFRRTFVLLENHQTVGSLVPAGMFTRKATAGLPDELSLPVKVFLIWLALILWKRQADSGAVATAAAPTAPS